jgi:hypothetical protein
MRERVYLQLHRNKQEIHVDAMNIQAIDATEEGRTLLMVSNGAEIVVDETAAKVIKLAGARVIRKVEDRVELRKREEHDRRG